MSGAIVVGVTGAPVSRRAIAWALERARNTRGGSLELVTVVGVFYDPVLDGSMVTAITEDAQDFLDEEAALLSDAGVPVTTRVAIGDPVAVLTTASAKADLVVIGSDYQGPSGDRARGSRGIRITAGAQCPVVVVPDIELGERRGVVVGVDGSPVSEAAVAFAAAEADRFNEPLIAVSAYTPVSAHRHSAIAVTAEYRQNLADLAAQSLALSLAGLRSRYPGLEIVEKVVQGYPSVAINDAATTARLTVVGSHGRGAVRRFLLGSISHEVLQRLETVTVVVR